MREEQPTNITYIKRRPCVYGYVDSACDKDVTHGNFQIQNGEIFWDINCCFI